VGSALVGGNGRVGGDLGGLGGLFLIGLGLKGEGRRKGGGW